MQSQNENQEKPKNFWQRLKMWKKIGIIVLGFISICIIVIRLSCVLPIPIFKPIFSLERFCQKDSDCIAVSCGCLNKKGARKLTIRGYFCGQHFDCFPPEFCVCKYGQCASADDWSYYNDSVKLSTNKIEYQIGEEVNLIIENDLSEDIVFSIISLENHQNNGWQELISDIYCSCNAECKKLPLSIEGFMSEEYDWDQKMGLCNNLLLDKKFRFRIDLWDNHINRPKMIYYSNEFTIKNDLLDTEGLNIIGDYRYQSTSMCSQNCSRYFIGSYELIDELENVEGTNKREVVFATGDMIVVEELPTIAGPDFIIEQLSTDKSKVVKFKIDNYQKIDFYKILISEKELSNYLKNENAEFSFEFKNPLNKELKFKFKIDDFERYNDFQHVILKPNEIKNVQYVFKKNNNIRNKREEDDILDLIVINDFTDEKDYKKYYWNEANNLDSNGTMIYIDKFMRLEDCIKSDISDWQTYRNEEFGFEFEYPKDQLSSYHKNITFLNNKITIKSVDDIKKEFEAMAATPSLKLKISKIVNRKIEILSEASDCAYPENFENDIKEVSDQLRKGIGKTAKVEGIYNDNLKKCGIKIIDNEGYSILMDNYRYTVQFLENDQIITFSFSLFPEKTFKDIDEFLAGLNETDYNNLYSSGDILDKEITAKIIERYDQILSSFKFIEK